MKFFYFLFTLSFFNFFTAQSKYILALSKADHQMVVLDYENLNIIKKIPVGEDPHEVITTENGEKAFVANTSNGTAHEINIIDLKNLKPEKNLDIRPLYGSHGLALVKNNSGLQPKVQKLSEDLILKRKSSNGRWEQGKM